MIIIGTLSTAFMSTISKFLSKNPYPKRTPEKYYAHNYSRKATAEGPGV